MILDFFNNNYSKYNDISIDAIVYLDLLLNGEKTVKKHKHIFVDDKLIIKSDIANMDCFLFRKINKKFQQVFIQSISKHDIGDLLYPAVVNNNKFELSFSLQCFKKEEFIIANLKKLAVLGEYFKNTSLRLQDYSRDVFHFLINDKTNDLFENKYYDLTKNTNFFIKEKTYSIKELRTTQLIDIIDLNLSPFSPNLYKLTLLSASNPDQLSFFCNLKKTLSNASFDFYFSFFLHNNKKYNLEVIQKLYDKVSVDQHLEYSLAKFLAKHKYTYLNLDDFFSFLINEDINHLNLLLNNFKYIQSEENEN